MCVCVSVCLSVSSACAVRPVYLPRGARALPVPLGSFLPRKWDTGVTSAPPTCPCCRGLAGGGVLQEDGGLAVSTKVAPLPCQKLGGCWVGSRGRRRGGRVLQPLSHRPGWTVTCPRFPASRAKQSWSSDPSLSAGCRLARNICPGGRGGWAARAHSRLHGSGLCCLGVLVFSQCLACILSNKAWW